MLASICTKYGPPDVLEVKQIEKPIPEDQEILIQIHASTVNRTDCAILRAKPFIMRFFTGLFRPKRTVSGTDFAGSIEAVGKAVSKYKVGDRVFGFDDLGLSAHAQYMALSEDKALTHIPENVSYAQAAASSEGVHYAYNIVNKVRIESGQTILVNGATGAIGSAAVQMLKYLGANVVAVCRAEHAALVTSLGADRIIDYVNEDFTKEQQQYDFVFDTVGKSSFFKCKPVLKPGGVYISSELGWMAQNLFFALITPLTGKFSRHGRKKVIFPVPTDIKASLRFVKELMEKGKFKAVIDRQYPLAQIADAYRYVETGQKTGNVVIDMVSSPS